MPYAPPHPCTYPGCPTLVRDGSRCEKHKTQWQREYNAKRGGSTKQGYGSKWQRLRAAFLLQHPMCSEIGCHMPASVVDHRRAHKGDQALFWDQENWQGLCKAHHDRKTATSDGRWGRGGSNR